MLTASQAVKAINLGIRICSKNQLPSTKYFFKDGSDQFCAMTVDGRVIHLRHVTEIDSKYLSGMDPGLKWYLYCEADAGVLELNAVNDFNWDAIYNRLGYGE